MPDRTLPRTKCWLIALFIAAFLLVPAADRAHAGSDSYKRTLEHYSAPDVTLISQAGTRVKLKDLLAANKPVMLDFIYGTCTTICPVLSAGYSNFQKKLGKRSEEVLLLSVSIDPENDTPEVMRAYLKRYRAVKGWDFLTGTREDIDKVMRAFDAYVPNKMAHYPLTLIKAPGSDRWVRIYGLVSTAELMEEYEKMSGGR